MSICRHSGATSVLSKKVSSKKDKQRQRGRRQEGKNKEGKGNLPGSVLTNKVLLRGRQGEIALVEGGSVFRVLLDEVLLDFRCHDYYLA
jgi:hypothetical protein